MEHPKYEATSPYSSPAIRHALELSQVYSRVDRPVLFVGPIGAGKTTIARETHRHSQRTGSFVSVSAGELTETLYPDRLWGHEVGAFTGAVSARQGAYAQAAGGTLLLDDLPLMARPVQAAILRVMETRRYRPLGSKEDRVASCRTFFATTVVPGELVADGRLLPDLYSRLGEFIVRVPSLSQRREDIMPLAHAIAVDFLGEIPARGGGRRIDFTPRAETALLNYDWPMNVRELKNVVERAALHARGFDQTTVIRLVHLPERFHDQSEGSRREPRLSASLIRSVLRRVDGNQSEAARRLGVHRNTIARYLKSAG